MSTLYMFPPNEKPTEDADVLAGEYVLGVLDPGDAAAARLRADTDPTLLGAIGAWQARLVPMTAMLPETTPPAALWDRLAADIGMPAPRPPEPVVEAPPPRRRSAKAARPAEPEAPLPLPDVLEAVQPVVAEPEPAAPAALEPEPLEPEPSVPEPVVAEPLVAVVAEPEPDPVDPPPDEPALAEQHADPVVTTPEPDREPQALFAAPMPQPVVVSSAVAVPTRGPSPAFARLSLPREPEPVAPPRTTVRLVDRIAVWRIATGVSLALAVGFAAFAFSNRPTPTISVAAIGVANAPAPIYLAELTGNNTLRVTPLAVIAVPNGRDLVLWMLSQDSQEPISLGVLPPEGLTVKLQSRPPEGTRFIVSMEPRGGAQTGRIAGQILYGGTLATR